MRMNMGSGKRANVVNELKRLRINCCRPALPPQSNHAHTRLTARKQKATGNPVAIMAMRLPRISKRTSSHSIR